MTSIHNKKALISGASIAGLTTAWWLNKMGYKVTVVEMAHAPRTAGAAIDIRDIATDAVKRMGIFPLLKANRLQVEKIEFKNADDSNAGEICIQTGAAETFNDEIEIERDKFISIMMDALKNNVEFIFNDRITALHDWADEVQVTLKSGVQRNFDLVLGCDGIHSGVRALAFGPESDYVFFLQAYFSISIVNKSLIRQKVMQSYNVPCKAVSLNAYKHKTDIIFCFVSEQEIPYDYRNLNEQRKIILDQFRNESWRVPELLEELEQADNFYFDKFCQVKMPSWTTGRIALVGDAGYCASPAAGMGASLSIAGAAALADALEKHQGDHKQAFAEYNKTLRPFIDDVQATAALNITEHFIPRTEEAIQKRNAFTSF